MLPKTIAILQKLVTAAGVLIFCVLLAICVYVFMPVPFKSIGIAGIAGTILHPLFIYPAVSCLLAGWYAGKREWKLAKYIFLLSAFVAMLIFGIPAVRLMVYATTYDVNVSILSSFYYKKNKGANSGLQTVSYHSIPGGEKLYLDVWPASTGTQKPVPVVLKIHGGGWTHGKKSDMSGWNSWLNSLGYIVFDVEYRLAPPEHFMDAACDIRAALRWIALHAERYNIDTGKVIIMGYSAGAHLALLTAFTSDHALFNENCGTSTLDIKAVIDLYGPTDLRTFYLQSISKKYVDEMLLQYIGGSPGQFPERYALLSPMKHISKNSPPVIMLHGENDKIVPVDESIHLHKALSKAGVTSELYILPQSDHGFDFHWSGLGSQIAREKVREFLNTYCH